MASSRLRALRIRLLRARDRLLTNWQMRRVELYIGEAERDNRGESPPVLFFNASTRIQRLSQNAAFGLLASWAVRLAGVPALHVVCRRGMLQCMLGTNRDDLTAPPPCSACVRLSRGLYPDDLRLWLELDRQQVDTIRPGLQDASLPVLGEWEWGGLPLGKLCFPTLRWALRRHDVPDTEATRRLFRQYLISAASVAAAFDRIIERQAPRVLVVFNGTTYPEAVARLVALRHGLRVITHEVGLRPFSAFFSHEHATFRQVDYPVGFRLGQKENERLQAYLSERFRGRFTMAGIRFWPEMEPLPEWLLERVGRHRQMIAVFTNVIFDTSQVHANTIYASMFEWLADLRQVMAANPETLFVLRAHPDEDRPGKESRESVADWVEEAGLGERPNVVFFPPTVRISSYDLIQKAKLTLVYNSSVGLEASILGAPVLCAGRARYTQEPTVFFPADRRAYVEQLESLLKADTIDVPSEFSENARRFLYYELYHASLDFSAFLRPFAGAPGNVGLSGFNPAALASSPEIGVLRQGILEGAPFALPVEDATGRMGAGA